MTKSLLLATFCLLSAGTSAPIHSQSENPSRVESVSLCDLAQQPEHYNGKMVEVRASVTNKDLSIDDFEQKPACSSWMAVFLVLPSQVTPKPSFDVARDDAFRQLFDALHSGMNVKATFSGQFEAAYTWKDHKQIWISGREARGFGKKGQYGGRIVLHRVFDVLARPVPRK